MPKDQEDDIKANGNGKGDVDANVPWTSHDSIRHRDAKASQNHTRPVASGEDMSVRLQHTWTVSAPRFIQGTYIPVVEVRASVKAPPAQQPSEKLFLWGVWLSRAASRQKEEPPRAWNGRRRVS